MLYHLGATVGLRPLVAFKSFNPLRIRYVYFENARVG